MLKWMLHKKSQANKKWLINYKLKNYWLINNWVKNWI
jgi:hypothetical protein